MPQQLPRQFAPHQLAAQKRRRPLGRARQHGLQVNHQHAEAVDAGAAHVLYPLALLRVFGELPGLVFIDVLIGLIGQFHNQAQRVAELAGLESLGDGLCRVCKAPHQRRLHRRRGGPVVKSLAQKTRAATGDIHQLAHHIGIHALHEVIEIEVDILNAGAELGGEVIAQILGGKMLQVVARVDKGAAALGHLGAVYGQKAVRVHGTRCAQARRVEDRRPEQTVKVDDVLADKVV